MLLHSHVRTPCCSESIHPSIFLFLFLFLFSSHLIASLLFSSLLISFHIFSSLLASLFSLLASLFSLLCSLFSLFSSHLIAFHLISSHHHLIIISSHLISSHLISSHLISQAAHSMEKDCLSQEMGGEREPEAQLDAAEKDAPPLEVFIWQQGWECVELTADDEGSVLQKLVDIDVQHNEAEVHHTPTNDRRETAEVRVTQSTGIPVAARHDREDEGPPAEEEVRKCLNAAFFFPHRTFIRSCRIRRMNARKMFKSSRMQSSP